LRKDIGQLTAKEQLYEPDSKKLETENFNLQNKIDELEKNQLNYRN